MRHSVETCGQYSFIHVLRGQSAFISGNDNVFRQCALFLVRLVVEMTVDSIADFQICHCRTLIDDSADVVISKDQGLRLSIVNVGGSHVLFWEKVVHNGTKAVYFTLTRSSLPSLDGDGLCSSICRKVLSLDSSIAFILQF